MSDSEPGGRICWDPPSRPGWRHEYRAIFGAEKGLRERDRDREHFLELVAEMHARYGVRIHAYAVMENHYHAVLQTPEEGNGVSTSDK